MKIIIWCAVSGMWNWHVEKRDRTVLGASLASYGSEDKCLKAVKRIFSGKLPVQVKGGAR